MKKSILHHLLFIVFILITSIALKSQETIKYDYSDIEIGIENFAELTLWSILDSCKIAECNMSEKFSSAYGEIGSLMQANNIGFTYYPLVITHFFDFVNYKFEAAIPIPSGNANIKTTGRVFLSKSPSGKMVKAVHKGSYNKVTDTYYKVYTYMKDKGLKERDKSFEVYVSDPAKTPEEKLITWIFFPIE